MNLDLYTQYIVPLVIIICVCVGYVIKNSLSFIPNKYIPLIMFILGIIINIIINKDISAEIFLGGAVSGLASVGTHQTCKCLKDKTKDISDSDNIK